MYEFNPSDFLILVVDDIPHNLQVMSEVLDTKGYETSFANNGLQALEQIPFAKPDLILLDLMMPEMDGIEVCQHLKSDPKFSKIPIIFLTASNEANNLVKAFEVGAVDYITKPFQAKEVLARIEVQLKNMRFQQELESKNQELKQEIKRRLIIEESLVKAKESAEAANRAKSTFLANMSHELRSPLNSILGFTELIQPSVNLTPEQQHSLAIIYRSGEHLLSLINDILDLSKIESGKIVMNPVDFNLTQMLWELEEMFHLKAHQKNLQLNWIVSGEIPQWVKGDRVKLRQVLINLIGNAIKFTQEGRVQLQVRSEIVKEELLLSFTVSDTGVGMTPQEIDHLFEPFVQGNAGITSAEGTGLGLAISRKYVQLLGGDISVTSEVGKGTTFQFAITLTPIPDTNVEVITPIRVISLKSNHLPYRILVVDDRESDRELLVKMLSKVGFDVAESSNGKDAIEKWEKWEPHLILMDLRMPFIDGYTATKKIKSTGRGKDTIIIIITANIFVQDKSLILSVGGDDILYKPIKSQTLFEKISQYLPINYVYEEIRNTNFCELEQTLTLPDLVSALGNLPLSLITQLEKATLMSEETLITPLLDQIYSHHKQLAKTLQHHLDSLEHYKILEAIETTKRNSISSDENIQCQPRS
jgi:signal transduction histidine kinase